MEYLLPFIMATIFTLGITIVFILDGKKPSKTKLKRYAIVYLLTIAILYLVYFGVYLAHIFDADIASRGNSCE